MNVEKLTGHRRTQITAHIERHLGPVTHVFRQAPGDASSSATAMDTNIAIHHVAATKTRPIQTLITSGMSDLPMPVPEGVESPRYLELMMTLPESWKLEAEFTSQDEWFWPVHQLQSLAAYPRKFSTWLGWGHTVSNGDPPEPLGPNTKLCGAIIVPSLLVPRHFYELTIGAQTIAFYSAVPLYKEELEMKSRDGMKPLVEKLADHGITDVIDPKRRNVAVKKLFGWF